MFGLLSPLYLVVQANQCQPIAIQRLVISITFLSQTLLKLAEEKDLAMRDYKGSIKGL